MTRTRSAFLLLLGCIAVAVAASPAVAADNAKETDLSVNELLTSASQAVSRETYRGVMVYVRKNNIDTLRVIHRMHDGREQERLVSLSGQPREVIRNGPRVTSILPQSRTVLISQRTRKGLMANVTQFSAESMRVHYKISDAGRHRLSNRMGRLIRIEPRDKYRYGYRMLIDEKTHLPLKLDLLHDDDVLEQMMFTEIQFPKQIPDSDFKPDYDIEGFQVIEHQAVQVADKPVPEDAWKPTRLPPGFKLAEDGVRRVTASGVVRQMLFTDGVATVSAFIAPSGLRKPLEGATTMGAVNAFGHIMGDTQITVVGEVPAATVKRIARHLVRSDEIAHSDK